MAIIMSEELFVRCDIDHNGRFGKFDQGVEYPVSRYPSLLKAVESFPTKFSVVGAEVKEEAASVPAPAPAPKKAAKKVAKKAGGKKRASAPVETTERSAEDVEAR